MAMGGNPVVYVDPDGELVWLAVAIGAVAGGYTGYKIADAKGYDFSDTETYGYILAGAAIGGASGWAGGAIAAQGTSMWAMGKAGMVAGAINGAGFSSLSAYAQGGSAGDIIGAGFGGALSGGLYGFVGGSISGGWIGQWGAITGGAVASGLKTAFTTGFDDPRYWEKVGLSTLIGGASSFAFYHAGMYLSYRSFMNNKSLIFPGKDQLSYQDYYAMKVSATKTYVHRKEAGALIGDETKMIPSKYCKESTILQGEWLDHTSESSMTIHTHPNNSSFSSTDLYSYNTSQGFQHMNTHYMININNQIHVWHNGNYQPYSLPNTFNNPFFIPIID